MQHTLKACYSPYKYSARRHPKIIGYRLANHVLYVQFVAVLRDKVCNLWPILPAFKWRFSSLDYMALTFLPGHEILYHKSGEKSSMKNDSFSHRGTSGDTPRKDCIKW